MTEVLTPDNCLVKLTAFSFVSIKYTSYHVCKIDADKGKFPSRKKIFGGKLASADMLPKRVQHMLL